MENVLPFSTLYSRPDAFRHLPSSGALTCNCYRVVIHVIYIYIYMYVSSRSSYPKLYYSQPR